VQDGEIMKLLILLSRRNNLPSKNALLWSLNFDAAAVSLTRLVSPEHRTATSQRAAG